MTSAFNHFKSKLIYQCNAPIATIQADIDQIRQFDKEIEGQQAMWGYGTLFAVLATIGVVVGGILLEEPTILYAAPVTIVAAIVCGILWQTKKGYNVDDNRYQLLSGILRLLAADTAKDVPISVTMDLRKPNHSSKYKTKGKAGHWNVKYYEDGWLNLRGKLMDGASYNLVVIEKFQARGRWKTSRSGKSKYKSKTKTATAAVLRVKPKASKHTNLHDLSNDVAGAVQLPNWVALKSIALENGVLVLKAGTKVNWSIPEGQKQAPRDGVQMIAMMFLSLYQVVNLSKRISKTN